jgi:uncharacterized protein YndB with AHSA1/START domain
VADYSFVTVWRIEAPIDAVYEAISESLRWPEWWPTVTAVVELAEGNRETGVGNVRRYTFKGMLPYSLAFDLEVTELARPRTLAGRARGELEGTGVWTLTEDTAATIARYDWNVRTTRWWMNVLAPLARPIFKANHDYVMRAGASGLGRLLGSPSATCDWVASRMV